MNKLYLHRDSQRGIEGTYKRLIDEVKELGDALNSDNKEELEQEFADVVAWLASLANVTDIDLERAALKKYDDKCPKCEQNPCQCDREL